MIYLLSELKKMNRETLADIARGLEIEVEEEDTKAVITEAILIVQSGAPAESIKDGRCPNGRTLEEESAQRRADEDAANDAELAKANAAQGGEGEQPAAPATEPEAPAALVVTPEDPAANPAQTAPAATESKKTTPAKAEAKKTTAKATTKPEAPATPAPAKRMVFSGNVIHNGMKYNKGDDANDIDETHYEALLEAGHIVEYVEPKTAEEAMKAVKKTGSDFVFVRNVMHNGVEFNVGGSANALDLATKNLFIEKGYIQLK